MVMARIVLQNSGTMQTTCRNPWLCKGAHRESILTASINHAKREPIETPIGKDFPMAATHDNKTAPPGIRVEPVTVMPRLSVADYARINDVSPMTVYRALKAGEIEGAVKVRHQWRIPASVLL